MLRTLLLVALGGAVGSAARAGVALALPFGWATLAVNLSGSFLIGLLAPALMLRASGPHPLAPLLIAGGLGGFTTFSAFSLDALRLIEGGRVGVALLYVGGTVLLGLLACWAGLMVGRLA